MMKYKGYVGVAHYDSEAEILHGEVMNIKDVITFQATSVEELRMAFQESVDDYLEFCKERGEEPSKPYSGQLTLRISPENHQLVTIAAHKAGKSLNQWIAEHIQQDAEKEVGTLVSKL
ncbi:type II toxin-antitoxin system HicB family antitoxin [Paenibacillus sp. PsM32]|uniref:type II toxin-antitoxin system HicB family antitoxin n=1 Tax=unclassified Paenibacillus TaxID=185978 RepID=UPI00236678E9|nr:MULTISPECIES: type II toxin-antitoxin system HicB family antitoxin [unclassified Paenibacillus]MDN4619156.1 type II toxin-antitoxin system HicB family antitoxin [Paenibacillus sp. PsM32]WDF50662.1 type II toxin-antitoxin system HicB family antitoxin [Paenibacillus sp. KACC 21273]